MWSTVAKKVPMFEKEKDIPKEYRIKVCVSDGKNSFPVCLRDQLYMESIPTEINVREWLPSNDFSICISKQASEWTEEKTISVYKITLIIVGESIPLMKNKKQVFAFPKHYTPEQVSHSISFFDLWDDVSVESWKSAPSMLKIDTIGWNALIRPFTYLKTLD